MSLTSYRAAPPRVRALCREERGCFPFLVRSGGDLLSHVLRRSTISAVVLNGRVRDGIGCFTAAMATRPEKKRFPSQAHRAVFWCMTSDVVTVLPLPDQIKPVGRLVPVN